MGVVEFCRYRERLGSEVIQQLYSNKRVFQMSGIDILFIILIWSIPFYRLVKFYLKSNQEQQEELRTGLKSPSFLFDEGFRFFGFILFFTGFIASITVLKHIGMFMIFIGWFSRGIGIWDKSIKKSVVLMSISAIGKIIYYFLVI